jgi:hypothetical protein
MAEVSAGFIVLTISDVRDGMTVPDVAILLPGSDWR